ncbi:uncharacterized protein [Montipora foliosa]|uniref:uncharacterized protein isoform X2 n=1 Tax=Montipora foliosa TaxID=591990 RepID=UPI0035F17319
MSVTLAVVFSFAKAHHKNHTSIVHCLKCKSGANSGQIRPYGHPFRLMVNGMYIISNEYLRENGIDVGSVVVMTANNWYISTTESHLELSDVLSHLKFKGSSSGSSIRSYKGISEAFPNANIHSDARGISQTYLGRQCALVSVESLKTVDGRIHVTTRLGEKVNLYNSSRSNYEDQSINELILPVKRPTSQDDVGDVILISFGSRTEQGNYWGTCEGIFLNEDGSASEDPDRYKMTSNPRGYCLILNNMDYGIEEKNRQSAVWDEQGLHDLFEKELHFEVYAFRDLKYFEMQQRCEQFAKLSHDNYDAFVCIIMAHGGSGDSIEGVDGRTIGLKQLMSEFTSVRCPSLAGKPKVFIVQACRGRMRDQFHDGEEQADSGSSSADSTLALSSYPLECDFLLAFATVPGYVAFRDNHGSLFIQVSSS